jgi:trk system potassium uptake protein TrkA
MVRYTLGGNVSSLKCLSGIDADIVEFIVRDGAAVTNKPINKLDMPEGAVIGGIIRGEDSFIATGNFQIQAEDRVVVLVLPKTIQKVEKLFR